MKKNTLREIGECLKAAPPDKPKSDDVEAWLFKEQNSVAVRLDRILGDEAVRDVLSIAAGRTWQQVTLSNGKAQNLWRRLGDEIAAIVQAEGQGLEKTVNVAPDGLFASLFPPKLTYHEVAALCWYWCQKPLAIKADLIFPYHGAWGLLPGDKYVWEWVKLSHANNEAVRFPTTGDAANARPVPPIGDFLAAMVMNRLGMMVSLTRFLGFFAGNGKRTTESDTRQSKLGDKLLDVRKAMWDTPDSRERSGAMSLLQIYLAREQYRKGFEADWSVIPWPTKPEELTLFIYNQREDEELFEGPESVLYELRNFALKYTFDEALKTHAGEVVSIVTDGLEWLRDSLQVETSSESTGSVKTGGNSPSIGVPKKLAELQHKIAGATGDDRWNLIGLVAKVGRRVSEDVSYQQGYRKVCYGVCGVEEAEYHEAEKRVLYGGYKEFKLQFKKFEHRELAPKITALVEPILRKRMTHLRLERQRKK
jgi:hypothetical protein